MIAKPGSFLALYRVDHPLRLARKVSGLYSDGWTAGDMALSQYATPGQRSGRLVVRLLRPTLVRRRARRPCAGDTRARAPAGRGRGRDRDRRPRREALDPSRREPSRRGHACRLRSRRSSSSCTSRPPSGPCDIGLEDTRQLGVQLSSTLRSAGRRSMSEARRLIGRARRRVGRALAPRPPTSAA